MNVVPHPHDEVLGPPFPTPTEAIWVAPETRPRRSRLRPIHVVLFVATLFTTTLAGSFQAGVNPFEDFRLLAHGLPFSATLMGILLVHEMGHFLMSRVHGVEATPPYFIPGPPFLVGTFGAFIKMQTPTSRKALFDVGAAGPWAGFLVAIPAVYFGLTLSEVESALRTIDGVRSAFVTEVHGTVGAAVVGTVGLDTLRADARSRLSAFKVPAVWLLLDSDDDVPRGATGKVDVRRLREMLGRVQRSS